MDRTVDLTIKKNVNLGHLQSNWVITHDWLNCTHLYPDWLHYLPLADKILHLIPLLSSIWVQSYPDWLSLVGLVLKKYIYSEWLFLEGPVKIKRLSSTGGAFTPHARRRTCIHGRAGAAAAAYGLTQIPFADVILDIPLAAHCGAGRTARWVGRPPAAHTTMQIEPRWAESRRYGSATAGWA